VCIVNLAVCSCSLVNRYRVNDSVGGAPESGNQRRTDRGRYEQQVCGDAALSGPGEARVGDAAAHRGRVRRAQHDRRRHPHSQSRQGRHLLAITGDDVIDFTCAQIYKLPLKPLSLHAKQHAIRPEDEQRPRSSIRMTGTHLGTDYLVGLVDNSAILAGNAPFTTIHEWVQEIFPEVCDRLFIVITSDAQFHCLNVSRSHRTLMRTPQNRDISSEIVSPVP
jgi:hypothetical protein